jgi:pimeloyl-ACP methyl ester carboxylesterase
MGVPPLATLPSRRSRGPRLARAAAAVQTRGVVRSLVVAVVLASVVIGACGGDDGDDLQRSVPPRAVFTGAGVTGGGRLVDIGGRSLYIECAGSGTPTVVLEAGFGGSSGTWASVFRPLSRTTRTCAYDRAGLGSSVGMPGVHDAGDEVADLELLLDRAGLPAPYVLVGHSYGGLLVRMFARRQPERTAGVVLVDSMGRDQTKRELALWPRSLEPAARRTVAQPVVEGVDLRTSEALAGGILTLDDTPLVVITAGRSSIDATAPARLRRAGDRLWRVMQDELAALSSDSVHVVALRSDHFVQRVGGQPRVVVRGVLAVVAAAREGTALPACAELFAGPAVRCRS